MGRFSSWLVLASLLLSGCAGTKPPAAADSAYANPKVCAGCHAEIARSYQQTGMGRSIGAPAAGSLPATVAHAPSGNTYELSLREGAVTARRSHDGFPGQPPLIDERRAVYAIGSGNHARSFLARNAEGRLVELPVTWYALKGGYWEMSPGFEGVAQEDFRRVVPDECLFCHSSYTQPLQAIDCQRCHGPGRAHAESQGKQPILNPKRLPRQRQLEVCMQCHLETTSSPLPNALRRFDRAVFSYRPGDPLEDYQIHFDHPPGAGRDGKFEIAHAAYRLRKSACFLKSEMTCSTCHDPHAARRGREAARCAQCHAQPHHPATGCIGCHMPKRRTGDAIHVVTTDHFIQRHPPSSATATPRAAPYKGEVALYYPAELPRTPANEAYLATAQVHHGANLDAGIPRLQAAVAKLAPPTPQFYFELAKAYSKKGDEAAAARWHEEALRRDPQFLPAIKGLAASLLALRQFERAAALLAPVKTPDARMLTNHGQALLELGRVDEAAALLQRAAAVNPELPETHDLLGLVAIRRGDNATAEASFREALRRQPDLATAHANLATLLAGRKQLDEARYHFNQSLAADPNAVETHRSLAFLLVLLGDVNGARKSFEAAARLAPSHPQPRLDLAELELGAGRVVEAEAQYRLALRSVPESPEASLGLGALLLGTGRRQEARLYLEAAARSADPAVRDAARRGLGALSR